MAIPAGIESFEKLGALDSIRDVLEHAEERIQKETMRIHGLHWLGSFKSQLTEVYGYIYLAEDLSEISEEQATEAKNKLDELTVKIEQLREEFETANKLLPAEIQNELLEELDVFHLMAPAI